MVGDEKKNIFNEETTNLPDDQLIKKHTPKPEQKKVESTIAPLIKTIVDTYNVLLTGITAHVKTVDKLLASQTTIHNILLESRRKKGLEVSVTHPNGGGSKNFITGTTKIDFFEGTVIYPDGTKELLLRNLKENNQSQMSAIYIKSDSEIKVNFDGHGEFAIRDYLMEVLDFQTMYITTTQTSAISFKAWTNDKSYMATAKLGTGTSSRVLARTEASQALANGALSKTTSSSNNRWKLIQVLLHSSVAISETVTITFKSGTGTNYSTILYSAALSAQSDVQWHPDSEIIGLAGDEITVACTNNNLTGTVYATIILEQI